jgi:hypothetical protein
MCEVRKNPEELTEVPRFSPTLAVLQDDFGGVCE